MRHRPSHALLAALGCAVGLALTGVVAFHWPLVQSHDAASLAGFVALSTHPRLAGAARVIANSVDPAPYVVAGLVLAAIALVRRRWLLALVVPVTMAGAAATTELVKPIVAHVRYDDWLGPNQQIGVASWPSGHATAAMTLGLCAVLVVPAVARPLVALCACVLAIGVSYSIVMLQWHFPSDVLGGFLVAGMWVALAIAVLWWGQQRWPARSASPPRLPGARATFIPLAIVGMAFGIGFGLLLGRTHLSASYASGHASLIAGAGLIALLAALLASAVAVVMRPAPRAAASAARPSGRSTSTTGVAA